MEFIDFAELGLLLAGAALAFGATRQLRTSIEDRVSLRGWTALQRGQRLVRASSVLLVLALPLVIGRIVLSLPDESEQRSSERAAAEPGSSAVSVARVSQASPEVSTPLRPVSYRAQQPAPAASTVVTRNRSDAEPRMVAAHAPAARSVPDAEQAHRAWVRVAGGGRLKLRAGPGEAGIGALRDGQEVELLDRRAVADDREWLLVRVATDRVVGSMQGWVAADFISTQPPT